MRSLLRLAPALVVFGLCSSAPLGDSVLLRLNYKAGDVLRYRMIQEQSIESELVPAMESESAFVFKYDVEKVDEEGVATIAVSYEGIRQESEGPMAMSFDSRRTGDDAKLNSPMLTQLFEPMLDMKLSMELEPTGRIRAIHGVDKLLESVTSALGDSAPQLKPMFESLFGEESLRRMWEFSVFPAEPIEPGYAWKRALEMEIPMMGSVKVEFDQTFSGVETAREQRCARIELEGSVSLDVDDSLPISVAIDSPEVTGWILFALDNGAMLETRQEIDMVMRMGPKDAAAGMPTMEMSMTIAQQMTRIATDAPLFED